MKTITITIPDGFEFFLLENDPYQKYERDALMIYPYIYMGDYSLRKAANDLGVSFETLATFYANRNLKIYDYSNKDVNK